MAETPWWVSAVAYANAPSVSVPYYFQAADAGAAKSAIGGTVPLAGPFSTKAEAVVWVQANQILFGPGKTNIAPPSDTPVTSGTGAGSVGKVLDSLNPLSGVMGDIAGGMENGVIKLFQDMWAVIKGPVFIALGIIFLLIAFVWFFKDQITDTAKTVAGVAGMAAAAA